MEDMHMFIDRFSLKWLSIGITKIGVATILIVFLLQSPVPVFASSTCTVDSSVSQLGVDPFSFSSFHLRISGMDSPANGTYGCTLGQSNTALSNMTSAAAESLSSAGKVGVTAIASAPLTVDHLSNDLFTGLAWDGYPMANNAEAFATWSTDVTFNTTNPSLNVISVDTQSLPLTGFLQATGPSLGAFNQNASALADLWLAISLNGVSQTGQINVDSFGNVHSSGLLQGITSVGHISTGVALTNIPIPTNIPLTFTLQLHVGAAGISVETFPSLVTAVGGTGLAAFLDTFTLPINGDVFVLPEGVTANDSSGAIINNRFAVAAVPEPSTLVLLVLGLAVLFHRSRLVCGITAKYCSRL
jgi:hypothetical protein